MDAKRIALVAALAAAGMLMVAEAPAAPSPRGGGPVASGPRHPGGGGHRPDFRPGRPGGHGSHGSWHGSHGGHWRGSDWGWGLGLAIGVPWALGWYDPWYWGPSWSYYPSHAYGPVYRGYGYACEQDEDCWRERLARTEPAPPTTEVAPAAPGEEGGPTRRPLHLNYCDSANAWFPHVRACPGGWRLVLPEYGAVR